MSSIVSFIRKRLSEDVADADEVGWPRNEIVTGYVTVLQNLVAAAEEWRWDRDLLGPDPKSDQVLELIAALHSDHQDYDPAWTPDPRDVSRRDLAQSIAEHDHLPEGD